MLRMKRDIVREAVKKCELPQYEVKKVLTAISTAIFEFMVNGDDVLFPPVGKFEVRTMGSRKVRNPLTGVIRQMPPQRRAAFRVYNPLKKAVKKNRRGLDG
jgi:nucleoid DNA-binding protein